MKRYRNLPIGARLWLAFAIVLALALALGAVGIARLQSVSRTTADMDVAMRKMRLSEQWKSAIATNHSLAESRLRTVDASDDAALADRMAARSASISKIQAELRSMFVTEQGKRLLELATAKRKAYLDIRDQVLAMKASRSVDQASLNALVTNTLLPAMSAYEEAVGEVTLWQEKLLDDAQGHVEAQASSGKLFLSVCVGVAFVFGMLLAWSLTRSIVAPLHEAVAVARRVADGDLDMSIEVTSRDETGQLMAALQEMTASLNRIVGSVRLGSDAIAAAASQVASGNLDLAVRTEQQAGSIEETAASIDQLAATVQDNAAHAGQASALAVSASASAARGGAVVGQVVDTMHDIQAAARKIAGILGTIDDIAFQTNILALNAAVEAARAGERGRGFAIVAGEVRSLAQRSATAAREIKRLIDDSVGKVDAGARLVNEAGLTIEEVVHDVGQVAGIMTEIAHASQEQSDGIQQVNAAIRQLDQVTQQNAALVEEAAAATASMKTQGHRLAAAVAVFKLGKPGGRRTPWRSHEAQTSSRLPVLPSFEGAMPARAALAGR